MRPIYKIITERNLFMLAMFWAHEVAHPRVVAAGRLKRYGSRAEQ